MSDARWLLYGAYGYTGELIAAEAVKRGHRPTLAGRSADKIKPLADRLGLPFVAVGLDDASALRRALEGHSLVVHGAGPFIHTALPMVQACLEVGAHYLDITGEIPVFEQSFAHDEKARARKVAIMSGVGFDVVPTDCMARHVVERVPGARVLELAISPVDAPSAGTVKSMVEGIPKGGAVRREGKLVPWPMGKGARRIRFSNGERWALPIPWGDLSTAYRTTRVPNITTYMAMPRGQVRFLSVAGRVLPLLLKPASIRRAINRQIEKRVKGPDEATRNSETSRVWARAEDGAGNSAEAWLDTPESYAFTAVSVVRCVEKTLALGPSGALTPAGAFGADFVLEIPGTRRTDVPR
jgi:short subunit dehydrogenase-like uncharacterized protein